MRCLRCGVCCTTHMVVIVVDPALGPNEEDNLRALKGGQRCPHLRGEKAPFGCAIHDREWFPETPCGTHGQMERHEDELCRLGNYHLNGVTRPGERKLPTCSG